MFVFMNRACFAYRHDILSFMTFLPFNPKNVSFILHRETVLTSNELILSPDLKSQEWKFLSSTFLHNT